jgi:hypothetical protein
MFGNLFFIDVFYFINKQLHIFILVAVGYGFIGS